MAKDEANEAAALSATLYEAASKNWKDDGVPVRVRKHCRAWELTSLVLDQRA
jgi:hypothetical protein